MALTTNLKALNYTEDQAFLFCKDACEKRGTDYDEGELRTTIIEYIYGAEFGTAKYNCKLDGSELHKYCQSLGDGGCRHGKSKLKFMSYDELMASDYKFEWVINDTLEVGGCSIFSGDPKAGKSTIIRQLVNSVLKGDKFLGRSTKKGKVMYFAFEESGALMKRELGKWKDMAGNKDLQLWVGPIKEPDPEKEVLLAIEENAPDLVLIDTLGDILTLEDMNNYMEVKKKFATYRDLARDTNAHIMFIHHNSKGGTIMGSQGFRAGTDTNIMLYNEFGNRKLTIEVRGGKQVYKEDIVYDEDTSEYSWGGVNEVTTEEF
jgi:hypothetical protein